MALSGSNHDREYRKFVESPTRPDQSAIEVVSVPADLDGSDGVSNYEAVSAYDETLSVASGSESSIVSYTVPIDAKFYLSQIQASGENIGTYRVALDGITIAKSRTWFNGSMEAIFNFQSGSRGLGLLIETGSVIEVFALHNRPNAGDFEGRILGVLASE